MFSRFKYQIRIAILLYGQTGKNRKWQIKDGGLLTSITYISACKEDNNEITTVIPMFSKSNYQIGIVAIIYYQTRRNRKWKIQDGGI